MLASRIGLAGLALALLGSAQQQPPPDASSRDQRDGVVVTGRPDEVGIDLSGPKPMVRGGLWRFDRGPTLATGGGSGAGMNAAPRGGSPKGFTFSTCLPDDDLEATLKRSAGERSNLPRHNICGPLRMTVGKGQIDGRRSCTGRGMGANSNLDMNVSGRYDARRLRFFVSGEEMNGGVFEGRAVPQPRSFRWQITANRVGECPAKPVAGERAFDEAVNLLFEPNVDEDALNL